MRISDWSSDVCSSDLGTLAAAIGVGLQLWIAGGVLWLIGHLAAVWAAKRDAQFPDVARRHLRYPAYLRVRGSLPMMKLSELRNRPSHLATYPPLAQMRVLSGGKECV